MKAGISGAASLGRKRQLNLRLWVGWLVLMGVAGGIAATIGILRFVGPLSIWGIVVGGAQWIVIRRARSANWWPIASIAGWLLGYAAGWNAQLLVRNFADAALLSTLSDITIDTVSLERVTFYAVGGAVLGFCQWRVVLRSQVDPNGWWILASSLGWAGAAIVVDTLEPVLEATDVLGEAASILERAGLLGEAVRILERAGILGQASVLTHAGILGEAAGVLGPWAAGWALYGALTGLILSWPHKTPVRT